MSPRESIILTYNSCRLSEIPTQVVNFPTPKIFSPPPFRRQFPSVTPVLHQFTARGRRFGAAGILFTRMIVLCHLPDSGSKPMQIREIVQQVLSTGFLSIEAEDQLRRMLSKKYDQEDFQAFMQLQNAAMIGSVRQESRLAIANPPLPTVA
jgi:hypothetical protein